MGETNRPVLTVLRLLFGSLIAVALGTQLVIQIEMGYSIANFFSFFTNLSNLFAAAVLAFGAFRFSTRRAAWNIHDQLRAVSVVNMTVVGIVYAALLRNADLGSLLPWVNAVLHVVMPCAIFIEWLLSPPTMRFGTRQLLLVSVFPIVYLIYTMVRGSMLGWYPYPFLNPFKVGSHGVTVHAIGIAVTFVIVGWSLLAVGNKLGGTAAANCGRIGAS